MLRKEGEVGRILKEDAEGENMFGRKERKQDVEEGRRGRKEERKE